jgi:protease I
MERRLNGTRVAILATDGVERSELIEPRKALDDAGATTRIVSPSDNTIRSWSSGEWSGDVKVDESLASSTPAEYDALLLPGGVINSDKLRTDERAVGFVRRFFIEGKPVAAICHAVWLLVEAEAVYGRTVTSYPSLRTDIRNAGGDWVDREVTTDEGLVTSHTPADLPAFIGKMLEEFTEGIHQGQRMMQASAEVETRARAD